MGILPFHIRLGWGKTVTSIGILRLHATCPPIPLVLFFSKKFNFCRYQKTLRINNIARRSCFNNQSGVTDSLNVTYKLPHHFSYSHTRNKFIAIGCDIFAFIMEYNSTTYTTGCSSLCLNDKNISGGFPSSACSGISCCRTYLQTDITSFNLRIRSINMITPGWTYEPCSLAFIAERNFSIRKTFNL